MFQPYITCQRPITTVMKLRDGVLNVMSVSTSVNITYHSCMKLKTVALRLSGEDIILLSSSYLLLVPGYVRINVVQGMCRVIIQVSPLTSQPAWCKCFLINPEHKGNAT